MNAQNESQRTTPSDFTLELPEISSILGLLEVLNFKKGREDIYKLSNELQMEYADTLKVIKGAEILKLVHTPGGDVVLEALGAEVCKSTINERKQLLNKQIRGLSLFKQVSEFLQARESAQATREEVQEKLAELLPNENAEASFKSLLAWGRYAELFGYNDDNNSFYLDQT